MAINRRSEIKIPISTTEAGSLRSWLKRMRQEDQNLSDSPKARFGKTYVRLDIMTAMAVMPWTNTGISGELDAYRFKKKVLAALHALETKEKSPWWRSAITKAIQIIHDTPVAEYMIGSVSKVVKQST